MFLSVIFVLCSGLRSVKGRGKGAGRWRRGGGGGLVNVWCQAVTGRHPRFTALTAL